MSKKLLFIVMVGVFACLPISSVRALMHTPTETLYLDPAKAYNGVTMLLPLNQPDEEYRLFHRQLRQACPQDRLN